MAVMSLFDIQDNFEICDQLFGRLCESCNEIDVDSCTELERVVTLVWHSSGLIENGGFHYLFEGDFRGDPGFVYTAAAYHRIGAFRAYEAFQDAIGSSPATLPTEVRERLRVYESIPGERWTESRRATMTPLKIRRAAWHGSYESTVMTTRGFSKPREPNPALHRMAAPLRLPAKRKLPVGRHRRDDQWQRHATQTRVFACNMTNTKPITVGPAPVIPVAGRESARLGIRWMHSGWQCARALSLKLVVPVRGQNRDGLFD